MDERRILLSSLAFSLSDSDLDTCASRPVSLEEKDPHKKSQTGEGVRERLGWGMTQLMAAHTEPSFS